MNAIQIKNNIINLNFIQKFSHDQPHRDDNNHLMYNVEFTFFNGKTENYLMTLEKFRDLTRKRKQQLDLFQLNNSFINLNTVQRITHGKPYDDENEIQCFDIEFVFHDGTTKIYKTTYEKFQQLIEKCDDKLSFVVDDELNTVYADDIK